MKRLALLAMAVLSAVVPSGARGETHIKSDAADWLVFPSNNIWVYASSGKTYGARYSFVSMSHDSIIGRYSSGRGGDTLIYFVLYRIQMLDPIGSNVSVEDGYIATYIHKIFVRDRIRIPLIDIDTIARRCAGGCRQWLPLPPRHASRWAELNKSVAGLAEDGFSVHLDDACDSMWAGVELILADPINPMRSYRDTAHLNNAYGLYRFEIAHRNGIDSLKPVLGVYSPFLYRCWSQNRRKVCYEYDLEFFPPVTVSYELNGKAVLRYLRPQLYATVSSDRELFPDTVRLPNWISKTALKSWSPDTLTVRLPDDLTLRITDDNTDYWPQRGRQKAFYGHYILQPAVLRDSRNGRFYAVRDSFFLCGDGRCYPFESRALIHHTGGTTPFNTVNHALTDTSTHYLLWLPDEIKAFGYNGKDHPPTGKPLLFHYVRRNPMFEARIFNLDSVPSLKILHSQRYFLLLEVKIVRKNGRKSIYISWVGRDDVLEQGFTVLGRSSSWKKWWQDPDVLLNGRYDSLFADTVKFRFSWQPHLEFAVRGDTLFWNPLPSRGNSISYSIRKSAAEPYTTTSDTFMVIHDLTDTTCIRHAVTYRSNAMQFRSEEAITWLPKLDIERLSRHRFRLRWNGCHDADFYEVWWKTDRMSDWEIDTTVNPGFELRSSGEFIAKVRGVKGQVPMSWGIVGRLNAPEGLEIVRKRVSGDAVLIEVRWDDSSMMEDGYVLEYQREDGSERHRLILPPNSTRFELKVNRNDGLRVSIRPYIIANPTDHHGQIYEGSAASAVWRGL